MGDFTALNWRPTQPARRRNTSTYCPAARRALICGNANIITDCPDHRALIEWVRGTRLRPYLARLDEAGRAALEDELLARAAEAYPLTRSGEVLFGFRRFFFTATR